jgi:O-antigen ligase
VRSLALERSTGLALAACLGAAALGALVAANPAALRLDLALSARGLLAVGAGLLLSLLVLRRPDVGLVLLVAFVVLNLSQVLVRQHRVPSLLQLLALPLAVAAAAGRDAGGRRRVAREPLTLALAAYAVVLFLSTTYAEDPALADERLVENLKALAVCLLAAFLATSLRAVRLGIQTLVAGGGLLAAVAVVQAVSGDFSRRFFGLARVKYAHVYGSQFEPRIAGPLGDPNFFAQVLVMLVPLALFLARGERRPRVRLFALAAGALMVAAVVLTYSRGGALALAGAFALALLASRVPLKRAALVGGVVALAWLFTPVDFLRRLTTLEQVLPGSEDVLRPDSSFQKRRLLVAAAWRMFLDHPLLGVGAGNYTLHFENYADEVGSAARDYEEPDERHYPHSLYLEIAAETGLLGFGVFGAAVALCFRTLQRAGEAFERSGETMGRHLTRGLQIALAGYLIAALFLHGHFPRYPWLLFGFAIALAVLAGEADIPRPVPRVRT